jgi:hypothetical protein
MDTEETLEGETSSYDTDNACRRHDHAGASARLFGPASRPRFACSSDSDLRYATSNEVVQAVFGVNGVSKRWGCIDYGGKKCWKKVKKGRWNYGPYCMGEMVNYGPGRYNDIQHNYGYRKEADPAYSPCDGDLEWPDLDCPCGYPSTTSADGTCTNCR